MKVVLDVTTQWEGQFYMVHCLVQLKVLITTSTVLGQSKVKAHCNLSETQWESVVSC